jgi:two-component system response regulator (stage 0 sporulation protein F)
VAEGGWVLVVDDQPGVRRLLYEVLQLHGYRVALAADGHEAVREATRVRPLVALVDLRMPGMSGLETVEALRRLDPQLAVVVMTAVNGTESEQAQRLGAAMTIGKPFDVHELRSIVDRLVRERAQGQTGVQDAAEAAAPYDAPAQDAGRRRGEGDT